MTSPSVRALREGSLHRRGPAREHLRIVARDAPREPEPASCGRERPDRAPGRAVPGLDVGIVYEARFPIRRLSPELAEYRPDYRPSASDGGWTTRTGSRRCRCPFVSAPPMRRSRA